MAYHTYSSKKNFFITLGILLGFALILAMFNDVQNNLLVQFTPLTGNAIYNAPKNQNCSEDTIKALWTSLLNSDPSSIFIIREPSLADCNHYIAYAVNNVQVTALEWKKIAVVNSLGFTTTEYTHISDGIFTTSYFTSTITPKIGTSSLTIADVDYWFANSANFIYQNNSNITQANESFSKIVKTPPGNWEYISPINRFRFTDQTTISKNTTLYIGQVINLNASIFVDFTNEVITSNTSVTMCITNYTAQVTCFPNETALISYFDYNNCTIATGLPANYTSYCDYDKNGLVGNLTTFNQTNLNVSFLIDGLPVNTSNTYNSSRTIEIKESAITRLKGTYDFSEPISFKDISIAKQPSSAKQGYLIVKGLLFDKTLTIDKLDPNSSQICIKEKEINSISEISQDCDGQNEYVVDCPGKNSHFNCSISGSTYVVSGVRNSGILELKPVLEVNVTFCVTQWACGPYGECINNRHTRVCKDLQNCNILSNKPNETDYCVSSCNSNWNCTAWSPETCSNNNQTRTCFDLNNCNSTISNKTEIQSCTTTISSESGKMDSKLIVILIGALVLVVAAIGFFLALLLKGNNSSIDEEDDEDDDFSTIRVQNKISPKKEDKPVATVNLPPEKKKKFDNPFETKEYKKEDSSFYRN